VTVPELLMIVRPALDHDHHEGAPTIVTVKATYWSLAMPGAPKFVPLGEVAGAGALPHFAQVRSGEARAPRDGGAGRRSIWDSRHQGDDLPNME
jgi:hypothetical protein